MELEIFVVLLFSFPAHFALVFIVGLVVGYAVGFWRAKT